MAGIKYDRLVDVCILRTPGKKIVIRCLEIYFLRERSYLFLRENSLESNIAFKPCYGMCGDEFCGFDCRAMDAVHVQYFDRPPFDKSYWCFCVQHGQPMLEVVDGGWNCCFTKLECCGKQVGLMPFESTPCFPLGLCGISFCSKPNRVTNCDNLFGIYGAWWFHIVKRFQNFSNHCVINCLFQVP